ncbi:hypothetical protein SOVF_128550, partial [Spinacia oleracea]
DSLICCIAAAEVLLSLGVDRLLNKGNRVARSLLLIGCSLAATYRKKTAECWLCLASKMCRLLRN